MIRARVRYLRRIAAAYLGNGSSQLTFRYEPPETRTRGRSRWASTTSVAVSSLPGAEIYVGLPAPVLATRTVGAPVSDGAARR